MSKSLNYLRVFENIEVKVVNKPLKENSKTIVEKLIKMLRRSLKIKQSKINKMIAVFLTALVLVVQNPTVYAVAQTAPEAPSAPKAPEPTTTPPPEPTAPQPTATPPPQPTAPEAPTVESVLSPTPTPTSVAQTQEQSVEGNNESSGSGGTTSGGSTGSSSESGSATGTNSEGTGSQTKAGQSGSTTINTGDANNTGNISTTANSNTATGAKTSTSGSGVKLANTDNGTSSTNSGSATLSDNSTTLQNNSANVGNTLEEQTVSGDNKAIKNTGGNNTINTGDSNTTGTIVTGVNTNIDAVAVYEFNITDDYNGDYVLDLANATCVSGCGSGGTKVVNADNGANSTNTGDIDSAASNNTFQSNDATVENNMTLVSDSGDNMASMNTGGDNTINTGDANVSGNVVNMVNNNLEGNIVYAVVNVFGDLIGDIILPDGTVMSCCAGDITAVNAGNGSGSTNTANVDQSTNDETFQFNNADIENNLVFDANTGNNDANKNTDGSSAVTTGDANLVAQVLNVANLNLVGDTWWLVLVNEAGQWIGKIIGAGDNQNYAGSPQLEFVVDESGEVTVLNADNGSGSTNTGNVSQTTSNTTVQENDAKIVNNVNLAANTGNNSTTMNTGGNNYINTGDANIVANIVNFVNNNIIGGGNLFVTVINVFGSWLGDFVGPGQEKQRQQVAVGGAAETSSNDSQSNNSNEIAISSTNNSGSSSENSFVVNTTKGVLGMQLSGDGEKVGSLNISQENEDKVAVAGEKVDNNTLGNKVVHINLAWLTVLLPLGLVFIIARKKNLRLGFAAKRKN